MSENELMGLRRRYGTQGRRFGKSVLSQPEVQVLRLAADGLRDKEIAAKLIKGEETVKAQISSILRRLEAHNRTHAVAIAIRAGLID